MTTIGAILALLRDMQPPSDGSARPSLRVAEGLSASGSWGSRLDPRPADSAWLARAEPTCIGAAPGGCRDHEAVTEIRSKPMRDSRRRPPVPSAMAARRLAVALHLIHPPPAGGSGQAVASWNETDEGSGAGRAPVGKRWIF